jgi:pyruvate,water dikinase
MQNRKALGKGEGVQMDYILNFDKVDKGSLPLVGGKNASLGEMIKVGIRVPPGFAVTTDSYLSFITEAGIKDKIYSILAEVNPDNVESLNKAAAEIRDLINSTSMSEGLRAAIEVGYSQLCEKCLVDVVPVAVRSSATAEDLPTASFAGQQETYLWVQGASQVDESVQKCWASLFTPRAISYRIKNNFPHEKVLISVGVQKMVNSKAAGVMFTINPTDGDPSKVVIEGSWGLGETVVSGSVNPDKFVVDKVLMETSEKTISNKHIECIFDPSKGEVVNADVDPIMQDACCMEDEEIKALVKMGKEIEAHYGRPMDIEWAIDKDMPFPENMFIVQARPETVWSQRKAESLIGKKTGKQLLMEQAMKRIKIPG